MNSNHSITINALISPAAKDEIVDVAERLEAANRASADHLNRMADALAAAKAANLPTRERMLDHFDTKRGASAMQERQIEGVAADYQSFALTIVRAVPAGPERTVALRRLFESRASAFAAILGIGQ